MKNPNYFSQCGICMKYELDIPSDRAIVERLMTNISEKRAMEEENSPEAKRYQEDWKKCEACFEYRLSEANIKQGKEQKPEIEKEKKSLGNKIDKDREFLKSMGIDPKSILG